MGQIFPLILAIWFSWARLGCPLRYLSVLVFCLQFPNFLFSLGIFPFGIVGVVHSPLVLTPPLRGCCLIGWLFLACVTHLVL